MNPELIVAELEETYLEHRQKGADGAKHGLGWQDTTHILREIQGVDGHIQRG